MVYVLFGLAQTQSTETILSLTVPALLIGKGFMILRFWLKTVKLNHTVSGRADSKQSLSAVQFLLSIKVAKCPLLSKLNRTF